MKPGMAYQLIIHMVSRVIVRGGAVVVSCESAARILEVVEAQWEKGDAQTPHTLNSLW